MEVYINCTVIKKKKVRNRLKAKTGDWDLIIKQCISCGVEVEGEYCGGKSCKFDIVKRSNTYS